MPEWPGGACPDCGDDMPPRVLRCRKCGRMLNSDLAMRPVASPELIVLPEVEVVVDVTARGYFLGCPNCEKELRISARYIDHKVQCKFCTAPFHLKIGDPSIRRIAVYLDCPHCKQELRVAHKYMGLKVGCKFCNGAIRVTEP